MTRYTESCHNVKTIADLHVGDIVLCDDHYARVSFCAHGNKFYAFASWDLPAGLSEEQIFNVSDAGHVLDCCK